MSGKQTHRRILSGLIALTLLFFSNSIFCNTYDFTVTVVDENGQPMIGVLVFTDDQDKVSDATDIDGKVVLQDMKYNYVINFQYLGYEDMRLEYYQIRNTSGIVRMKVEAVVTEIAVVVGRADDIPENIPYYIQKVDKKDIALTNSQTAADALRDHGGVFVQKSQMGGGSPVVRGFEANKVLLVLDGVRMNNAIYRSGHLQNAITIDNAMLERLEVLYGPGSLIYGSDAIGGVVHFRSKNPKLNFDIDKDLDFSGNGYVRYASANNEKSGHIDFNIGGRRFGSLTSISYSDYGDLRTGSRRGEAFPDFGKRLVYADRIDGEDIIIENDDPNVQIGTGYQQVDILQKFLYQPSDNIRLRYCSTSN